MKSSSTLLFGLNVAGLLTEQLSQDMADNSSSATTDSAKECSASISGTCVADSPKHCSESLQHCKESVLTSLYPLEE